MSNFFKSESKSNVLRCYLLYPKDCSELFEEVVSPFLQDKFDLEYHQLCYESMSRESIQQVRRTLENPCILLFAYIGDMTLEYSYKLGLAHACDARVILISFQSESFYYIPGCINYDFLVPVIKNIETDKDLDSFLENISSIIFLYLSEDLVEFLYKKAVSLCEELEKETSCILSKVEKKTFSTRISEDEISICINDYDKSSKILLRKVVENNRHLAMALNILNVSKRPMPKPSDIGSSIINYVNIENRLEATAMNEPFPRQQIFQAPVGVVANDYTQVPHFTQNNNTNVVELLQLISAMRQTAAQFPQDIQNDLIIDLDDVESEIKKLEADRNLPKIKKRLLAILTAVSLISGSVAGMTDFANNAIDVGGKLGIKLHLPPAP